MIPDLGEYTFVVTLAYAGTFLVLPGFIWSSLIAHRKAMSALQKLDKLRDV